MGRGAHEGMRRIWRLEPRGLLLAGVFLLQARIAPSTEKEAPPSSPGTALPNFKAVEDVLPSSLPFTAVFVVKFGVYSTLGSPDGPRGAGGGGAPVCFAQWAHNRRR